MFCTTYKVNHQEGKKLLMTLILGVLATGGPLL